MKLNLISISDIHLGKSSIPPEYIPDNIRKYLYPHLNKDLDILFIVGDFFDTILDLNSKAGFEASCIIHEIIDLSIKNDFIVRVLQGTYTHDRHQNMTFKSNTKMIDTEDRLKVFEDIDLEYIERFNINVLYIPDDLPNKNIMDYIYNIQKNSNIKQFDLILHHGYFKHILPIGMPHEPINTLDADILSKLVKGVILNGHIHTPSMYKKVINNGSFDRLTHNEEEPKGFFKLVYDTKNSKVIHEFIENKDANIFKSIYLHKCDDLEDAINVVRNKITKIRKHIKNKLLFIRIISDSDMIKQGVTRYISTAFENIKITSKKYTKNKNDNYLENDKLCNVDELPKITEDNIIDMVVNFTKKENIPLSREYVMEKLR
jgi:hypothetical protein